MRLNPKSCMSCGKAGRSTTDVAFFFCDDWCYREELNKLLPEGRKTYSTFYLGPWQTEDEYFQHHWQELREQDKGLPFWEKTNWFPPKWLRDHAQSFMEKKREWDAEQQSWIEYAKKQILDQVTAEDRLYKAKQHEKERIALERRQAQERREQERQAERERREQERQQREADRLSKEQQREQERADERARKEAERQAEEEARRIKRIDPYSALK
jgi:hypothetical protein